MTRQEFLDNVCNFSELISFCYDNGYEDNIWDNGIYDSDSFNDIIMEEAREYRDWEGLSIYLAGIPIGLDYYTRNDWGEWTDADIEKFEDVKEEVLERADEDEIWDAEPQEDIEDAKADSNSWNELDDENIVINNEGFLDILGAA